MNKTLATASINELTPPCNLPTEIRELVMDWHFADIGLTEEALDVRLTTWKESPSVSRIFGLNYDTSTWTWNETGRIAECGTVMTAASASPDPNYSIFYNYGKSMVRAAVPCLPRPTGTATSPLARKKNLD